MLITPEYRAEQRRMHENGRYGAASRKFAPFVIELIKEFEPKSILDYGAGKRALKECLAGFLDGVRFKEYDPGIKKLKRIPPDAFDLVCCLDVLEHVEPECLDSVLDSLRAKTGGILFLTIHTGPAGKILSDGRNAHLIQEPLEWWAQHIGRRFEILRQWSEDNTAFMVCR